MWKAVIAALLSVVVLSAGAAPVSLSFSGTITSAAAPLAGLLLPGDSFQGVTLLDSDAPDSSLSPGQGVYDGLTSSLTVGAHAFTPAMFTDGQLVVGDGSTDLLVLFHNLVGPSSSGFTAVGFSIGLVDSSGSALASDAVPLSLGLNAFDSASFSLVFREDTTGTIYSAFGTLDTFSAAVPEPSSFLLIALGLGSLVVRQRSRRRITPR